MLLHFASTLEDTAESQSALQQMLPCSQDCVALELSEPIQNLDRVPQDKEAGKQVVAAQKKSADQKGHWSTSWSWQNTASKSTAVPAAAVERHWPL